MIANRQFFTSDFTSHVEMHTCLKFSSYDQFSCNATLHSSLFLRHNRGTQIYLPFELAFYGAFGIKLKFLFSLFFIMFAINFLTLLHNDLSNGPLFPADASISNVFHEDAATGTVFRLKSSYSVI